MTYTPVELRHVQIGRSVFGYNREVVEQVIEEVADSFETAWRERGELADQVHALEKQVVELKGREQLLMHTLVAAEQAASDVREHAKRDAELILAEAHSESRAVVRSAQNERERLFAESRRIESLLRSALGTIQESSHVSTPVAKEQSPTGPWPAERVVEERREDTREFTPIQLPPVSDAEPAGVVRPEQPSAEPPGRTLRRVVGGESRDFDWGD